MLSTWRNSCFFTVLNRLLKSARKGLYTNELSYMGFDLAFSIPTESGFPFVYTFEVPTVGKIEAESHVTDEKKSEKFGLPSSANIDIMLKLVYSVNLQGRIGFVTPFESKHYVAGYDKQQLFYLPVHSLVKYDLEKNRYGVQIQPLAKGEKYKLFQMKNVPFTTQLNLLALMPVSKHASTKIVKENDITSVKFDPGLGITWESDYEKSSRGTLFSEEVTNALKSNFIPWLPKEMKYSEHVFAWTSDQGNKQFLNLSLTYESLRNCSKQHGDSTSWTPNAEIPVITAKESDSRSRRKCLLKVSRGVMNERDII